MKKPIKDQVVVVTGASSGIGRATAIAFAKKGAKVVGVARSEEGLRTLIEEIHKAGGEAMYVVADVADYEQMQSVAEKVEDKYGRIDTWINNAAVIEFAAVEFMTPDEYKRITDVDYLGQVWGTLAALPHVRKTGGTIIFMGALEARIGFPFLSAYGASKRAVEGFADSLRLELMHEHSQVSVVHVMPSAVNTPFFNKARTKLGCKPIHPGPIYKPEEVVKTLLWCAVHPRRDILIGAYDKLIMLPLKKFSPKLMDFLMSSKMIYKQYFTQEKKLADEDPDNLYKHIPGGKYDKVIGDFSSKSGSSWYDSLRRHPRIKTALKVTTLTAVGATVLGTVLTSKKKASKRKIIKKKTH